MRMRDTAPEQRGAEILRAGERSRVTRIALAGRTVIRKQPLGPDAAHRLRHESGMLTRLRGVTGIAQSVDAPAFPDSIVLEDAGRTSLAQMPAPLPVDELMELALTLARAVAEMHGRGVMHRDIAPGNIVVSSGGAPCLVDFAVATAFAEIRPEFTHHREIVGTLPYVAPEQTGRTGRSVDQRADLYALGATLYHLATGAPPFGSGDPLRLIHDHLAQVPRAPSDINAAVPASLSDVLLHLLEKEPDIRYQAAEGVLYDLERLRATRAGSRDTPIHIGEHDVPPRLVPPSRLVGREREVAALQAAFDQSLEGRCRAVLVVGAPGVGKTALVDELRGAVTARDGWFATGKFDQYRRDLAFDGVYQAFRALGRFMLAEPEKQLGGLRERLLGALGQNAGLATAVLPELAALLRVPPDPGDPLTAQVRAQRNSVDILRAVASRERPVVLFVDDLQWAGRTPLGLFDLVLNEAPIEGLLLVGAYREGALDRAHPLAELLARLPAEAAVERLHLDNLPSESLVTLIGETLHRGAGDAAVAMAEVIQPHTSGNPYETVEVLNALRRDGLLTATASGWRWDDAAVRRRLGQAEVAALSAARIDALPQATREIIEAMACLGGHVELTVIQTATGEPVSVVEQRLAPALEDGLLVMEPGAHEAVRFRHDRVRELIVSSLRPRERQRRQLAMARRLAAVPELFAVAAEQYLPAVDGLDDPAERPQVVGLLRRAAEQAVLIGDHRLVDALLTAALRLIDDGDAATLIEVQTARHGALYSMARLEAADQAYSEIERLAATVLQRASATTVQVRSLTHRNRVSDALQLGLDALRELGVAVPGTDRFPATLDPPFEVLYRWLDSSDDAGRPELADPRLLAAAELINAILPAAYFSANLPAVGWLGLEAIRIWLHHGPNRALLGPASHGAFAAVALQGDHSAGDRAYRRILTWGEAHGYEPETSQARFVFSLQSCWVEPVEKSVQAARRARNGLIAGGDLANAGYSYHATVEGLLDIAPSLDELLAEIDAGFAFLRRTASEESGQWLACYQWLAGCCEARAVPVRRSRSTASRTTRRSCSTRSSRGRSPRPSSTMRRACGGTPPPRWR